MKRRWRSSTRVDRLRNADDYTKLMQEVSSDYLNEATVKSPEYLLELMAQIVEVFLARLNIPLEEVDIFTSQIKSANKMSSRNL